MASATRQQFKEYCLRNLGAPVQMDLLRADVVKYGGDLTEYEALIADVESNIQPYVEPVKTQEQINQEALAYLNSTDWCCQ